MQSEFSFVGMIGLRKFHQILRLICFSVFSSLLSMCDCDDVRADNKVNLKIASKWCIEGGSSEGKLRTNGMT